MNDFKASQSLEEDFAEQTKSQLACLCVARRQAKIGFEL